MELRFYAQVGNTIIQIFSTASSTLREELWEKSYSHYMPIRGCLEFVKDWESDRVDK